MAELAVLAIIQARMESSRFPGKVVEDFDGEPLIVNMYNRASKATMIDKTVVAVPYANKDSRLHEVLQSKGIPVFFGEPHDVQMRFIACATAYKAQTVVRLTADCPLIDWAVIDDVVAMHKASGSDYTSNTLPPTFPDGLDVEAFELDALVRSRSSGPSVRAIEHVTIDLRENDNFFRSNLLSPTDFSSLRWTIDYPSDLREILQTLPVAHRDMGWLDLVTKGFAGASNTNKVRNEGLLKSSGQKVWQRAKKAIPGGSMLLSKRPEMFLPEQWPSYYSKAKGVEVTDLDGNTYIDFSTMSVGACSLGYGNPKVDAAVCNAVSEGVMSSLNSPAEVDLAERLISLHPWSEMARFARSGGEANAIAVRIARAHTGKDKVAICGYHGWHDWYLAANLGRSDALDGYLLRGLEPRGVPTELAGTSVPFLYNNIASFEEALAQLEGKLAAVVMEPMRSQLPQDGFLQTIAKRCRDVGGVLVIDEVTSGLRYGFPGASARLGIEPDLAVYAKAMSNGFPFGVVVGRKPLMEASEASFISSSYWTDGVGTSAALAVLKRMEQEHLFDEIWARGTKFKKALEDVANRHPLCKISVSSMPTTPTFVFNLGSASGGAQQWYVREMLKRGIMASSFSYLMLAHSDQMLSRFLDACDESLGALSCALDRKGPDAFDFANVPSKGFARLA